MSDIVEELQQLALDDLDYYDDRELVYQAAEEIKKLRAELEKHQWRTDMENAPRDKPIDLYGYQAGEISGIDKNKKHLGAGYFNHGSSDYEGFDWVLCSGDAYAVWANPTHWKPLDKPEDV